MTETVSGHELGKTHNCRTPGCPNEARSRSGRHAFCVECQIRRGTRRADGSLITEAIPTSPGSRHVRDLFKGDGCGPFEAKAIEVVAVSREVDALLGSIAKAQEQIADAKARLPAAIKLWRETVERVAAADARSMIVPPSSNGVSGEKTDL